MKEYKDYAKITAHFDLAIEEAIKFGGDVGKHVVLLFETMRNELDTVPAADVVEVRRGYWIDKGWDGDFSWQIDGRGNCWHVYECSECKSQICGSPKTEWCSYCGAKMDL